MTAPRRSSRSRQKSADEHQVSASLPDRRVAFPRVKATPEKQMRKLIDVAEQALSERLYQIRTDRGLTQTELSAMAGVDRKTINRIENGHFSPSIDTLIRLSIVLKVPVAKLVS